jgi:hypothetical protein
MIFAWVVLLLALLITTVLLLAVHATGLGRVLHEHIQDTAHRRLLLASVSFLVTFAAVRALTWAIHNNIGPFHDVDMGGRHIHHLVWGILLLLLVGYGWLAEIGSGDARSSIFVGRLMSICYGVGAALTLDEFALWLNLRDVYWAREGRASLDAAIIFAAFLWIGVWSAPLVRSLRHRRRRTVIDQ